MIKISLQPVGKYVIYTEIIKIYFYHAAKYFVTMNLLSPGN